MKPLTPSRSTIIATSLLYLVLVPALFIFFVIGLGAAAHLLYYLLHLGWTWC